MKQEDFLQISVVKYINLAYGNDYMVQMNYNNAYSASAGAKAKKMGRVKGFPDLQILDLKQNRILFLEIKTEQGKLSKEQKQISEVLKSAGYSVYTGIGFDNCKNIIDKFCNF
jgi:hypothetical protein